MSVPPPPPYRKLERSRSNRVVGGVCGGLAAYARIDPTLVRVLTVVLSLSFGFPIIVYLLALFLMPEEGDSQPPEGYPPVGGSWTYEPYPYQFSPYQSGPYPSDQAPADPTYASGPGSPSGAPRQYGVPPTPEDEAVWGPGGAPWQQPQGPAPQPRPPSSPNPFGSSPPAPQQPPREDERG